MPTPSKPTSVIRMEQKSHRTKRELAAREKAETSLVTGTALKARDEVKNDPVAYKEFKRISKLLSKIEKNDALVEGSINRYCQLTAEVAEFERKREDFSLGIRQLEAAYEMDAEENSDLGERVIPTMEYFNTLAKMEASLINLDRQIMTKRKMLLDLERENIMTIASQLRAIPKKADDAEDEDPMARLFSKRGTG